MYEEQDFDLDTIGKTQKNKKIIKIVVIVAVLIVLVVVGFLFLKLYNGEGGNTSEDVSQSNSSFQSEIFGDSSNNAIMSEISLESGEISENSEISDSFESNESEQPSEEPSEEASEEVSEEPEHGWVINNMGYTYLYQGKGYNQFNGTKSTAEKYAAALNKITTNVSFPIYSMIAPTAVEFVEIPYDVKQTDDFYNSSQKAFISNVNGALNFSDIDIYSSIADKAKDEYLYLRTDKNWTADAAYLAYVDFCAATGNIAAAKTGYEMGSYVGYLGNFYNATGSGKLKANADDVNFYKINAVFPCSVTMYSGSLVYKDRALIYSQLSNPVSYGYYAFLGDRGESFSITSQNSSTEKSILVVGDSSAFAFVPFLAANYRNIYFINAEAYNGNLSEYMEGKDIDEGVILSYASNAAASSYINKLDNLFTSAS